MLVSPRYIRDMRSIVRTMMFLACLIYGSMPGMAATGASMPMPMSMPVAADMTGHAHGDHVAQAGSPSSSGQSDPCPHKDSMTHAPFCAACLVLLPNLVFAEKGRSLHAAPMPGVQAGLYGNPPAPPLPPPRA